MLRSVFLLIAAIAMSARTGSGRSGSLLNVQSALRAHLARIEETPHGICFPEACQYWTPEPVCSPLYSWAKKHVSVRTKRIPLSLEQLRKVLGPESVKDAEGNIIQEAPLPVWANFRQRALDVAIAEINKKTDLRIKLASIERSKHQRVVALTFAIKTQATLKRRPTS
jgi:hypothetical protein